MSNITAKLVKDLRDKTGAGMMDCKKALNETNGSLDKAIEWLRKKGIASAEKKSGRVEKLYFLKILNFLVFLWLGKSIVLKIRNIS